MRCSTRCATPSQSRWLLSLPKTPTTALFLETVAVRPLYARAASDNVASLRVLQKAGFIVTGTEVSHAPARGTAIEETILCLR